jgi:hypothetical protein
MKIFGVPDFCALENVIPACRLRLTRILKSLSEGYASKVSQSGVYLIL